MTQRRGRGSGAASWGPGSGAQARRRERILAAATGLASQGGYDAVQMRAVAERAEVALGTLYRYFPSKIHLLVSVLEDHFAEADAEVEAQPPPGDDPRQRVTGLLRRHTARLQQDPQLTGALVRAFMSADAGVEREIDQVGRLLISMLTRAMVGEDGEPGPRDTAIARVIGDVWFASLVGWASGRTSAEEVQAHMDVTVELLLR